MALREEKTRENGVLLATKIAQPDQVGTDTGLCSHNSNWRAFAICINKPWAYSRQVHRVMLLCPTCAILNFISWLYESVPTRVTFVATTHDRNEMLQRKKHTISYYNCSTWSCDNKFM